MDYQSVTFFIGIGGVLFTIYSYFRDPQVKLEKGESLISMSISQLQKDLANLRDNHIHTLETKIDATNDTVSGLAIEVAKLSTTIEERIPKRRLKN